MTGEQKVYAVRTGGGPEALNDTLLTLPGVRASVVDDTWNEVQQSCHVVVEGDAGFFLFAMKQQGYGEVMGEAPNE